jgi:hypothetical protein
MKTALYQNQEVTPSEFRLRAGSDWLKLRRFAHCKVCQNIAEPWGVHLPDRPDRFDHENNVVGCPLSAKPDIRYAALKPTEVDIQRIDEIRNAFMTTAIGTRAEEFCDYLVGPRVITNEVRQQMIAEADRFKVWGYRNILFWVLPYVFLTLVDFKIPETKAKPSFYVQFRFLKPFAGFIDDLWNKPDKCALEKVFIPSGKPSSFPPGNPYPLSEAFFWTANSY